MSNIIKHNPGNEQNTLRLGNYKLNNGYVGDGISYEGYYPCISPSQGGYVIYEFKPEGGPSIRTANDEQSLISTTNQISGNQFTTKEECLEYFANELDKTCINMDYEPIITDSLYYLFDPAYSPSNTQSGQFMYNVGSQSSQPKASLPNTPEFLNSNGGVLSFNGVDDGFRLHIEESTLGLTDSVTMCAWLKIPETSKSADILWLGFDQITDEQLNFLYRFETWTPNTWSIVANYTLNNSNRGILHHEYENITLSSGWNFYSISLNIDGTYSFGLNGVEVKGGVIEGLTRWNVNMDACLVSGGVAYTPFEMGPLMMYNRGLTQDEVLYNYNTYKTRFGK